MDYIIKTPEIRYSYDNSKDLSAIGPLLSIILKDYNIKISTGLNSKKETVYSLSVDQDKIKLFDTNLALGLERLVSIIHLKDGYKPEKTNKGYSGL